MSDQPALEFILKDRKGDVEVSLSTIGLKQFNEFNQQIQEFLAGSERLDLSEVWVSLTSGSYRVTAHLTPLLENSIQSDFKALQREDMLGEIDPRRAEIIEKWQARSKERQNLRYILRPKNFKGSELELSKNTNYRIGRIDPWVKVEKYLLGTILDIGGARKANVHLRLEDSGQTVIVESSQDDLRGNDRLYHKALLHVEADQHFKTKELRDIKLLAFEDYALGYNEEALDAFIEDGTKAWKDVPDASTWVRELRGGKV